MPSLVGSEMCIRDRAYPPVPCTAPQCTLHPVCVRPGRVILTSRSMHRSAMLLPTCSVRCPATHHPIVLCTAPPWACPPVPCTAPQCTWPRAVYGLSVQSSRLVPCTVPSGTCQPVPWAGPPHTCLSSVTRPLRERLRSFRARLCRTLEGLFRVRPRRALPSCPFHGTRFCTRLLHLSLIHI